jgi:hypothetical protein
VPDAHDLKRAISIETLKTNDCVEAILIVFSCAARITPRQKMDCQVISLIEDNRLIKRFTSMISWIYQDRLPAPELAGRVWIQSDRKTIACLR